MKFDDALIDRAARGIAFADPCKGSLDVFSPEEQRIIRDLACRSPCGSVGRNKDKKSVVRYSVGTAAMARVIDAMAKSGVEFWDVLPRSEISAFVPTDPISPKLAIVLATVNGANSFLSLDSGLPEWLDETLWGASDRERGGNA